MKKILVMTLAFVGLVGMGSVASPLLSTVGAQPAPAPQAQGGGVSPVDSIRKGTTDAGSSETDDSGFNDGLQTVMNILMFLLGAIAVIMIVIGGLRYTTSNGDAGTIKSAKDTILYAVVGLIVALIAYAIVSFVITQFTK